MSKHSSSKFQLESGIPIPPKARGNRAGSSKYPFAEMQIGESFLITSLPYRSVGGVLVAASKRTGYRFCQRATTTDAGKKATRVWRIA